MVSFSEVLDYLATESASPIASSLGPMLEKMRNGTMGIVGDPYQALVRQEADMVRNAEVIGCLVTLAKYNRVSFCRDSLNVHKFARNNNVHEGSLVVAILKAYQKFGVRSEERGLQEVFKLLRTFQPSLEDCEDLEDHLKQGKAVRLRNFLVRILGDCELILGQYVSLYNRKLLRGKAGNVSG